MGVNVGQILRQAALRWPERTALVDVGHPGCARRELSFAALDHEACFVAARLLAAGVRPGECIALIGESSAEFAAAWFGIAYAGCAVVPVPILSAPAELRFRVEHAACTAVLFDPAREALVREALVGLEPAQRCLELGARAGAGILPVRYPADTDPSAIAMVLYTSGTTGTPKGAAISHASFALHTAALVQHTLRLAEDDRVLGVLPLTHSYGCRMAMLAPFFAGARTVLMPRFDAARSFALLCEEKIHWLPAVPTMYAAWAALAPAEEPSSLRWCLSAGAPLAEETARRAEHVLGCEVRQGYGMTEATFSCVNAPPDRRVFGSVGKPVWGVEVRVIDEAGRDRPPGESGEVVVRGQNAMSRYLHDPEASASVASGGFIHSGDVGRFDAEGRLAIVDRIKDLIIRGGHNVYPSEVEAALAEHPAVLEVAVIARPDDYYGEEIVAVVIKRPGSALERAELVEFARPRLSRIKLPREIAFVDALPLGPSGKVEKRTLREWLRQGRVRALPALARSDEAKATGKRGAGELE